MVLNVFVDIADFVPCLVIRSAMYCFRFLLKCGIYVLKSLGFSYGSNLSLSNRFKEITFFLLASNSFYLMVMTLFFICYYILVLTLPLIRAFYNISYLSGFFWFSVFYFIWRKLDWNIEQSGCCEPRYLFVTEKARR